MNRLETADAYGLIGLLINEKEMNDMTFGRKFLIFAATLVAGAAVAENMVPLEIKLPGASFKGTPKDIQPSSYTEPYRDAPSAPMMVPPGLKNLAPSAKLSTSSTNVPARSWQRLPTATKKPPRQASSPAKRDAMHPDGFGAPAEIFAIVIWHAHPQTKVYHDVIVQVSDDPDFQKDVKTIFNNDQDNSSGLGVGTDREYFETHDGKLIDAKGVKARYIRFYSKGSTESALNEYTELEVYGRPAK